MPPDSTTISEVFSDPVRLGVYFMALVGALATIAQLISTVKPWVQSWYSSRSITKRLGAELYTPAEIIRATRYYVKPKAQDIDPAHAVEPGSEKAVKEDLFNVVDRLLNRDSEFKYSVLLADSGMGKTAFLLNYYKRYLSRRKRFRLEMVPLGRKDADERIQAIEHKSQKVLFLDALDEDVLAIVDHKQRIADLCEMTQEFLHVLFTCRTQFFPAASEEPARTGVLKVATIGAGRRSEYTFHKRYLSPFDDQQVETFLKKRYGLFQPKRRRKARQLVDKIPRLTMRPMLLSYIDELLQPGREYRYAFQLYDRMVDAWLIREEGKVEGMRKEGLLSFCKQLALHLYVNREEQGAERISSDHIGRLARNFNLNIETWKLSGRSLLNRDAEDFFKFAHRSIMEHLLVKHLLELEPPDRPAFTWTDQMKMFLTERLRHCMSESGAITINLDKVDLTDLPEPVYSLRSVPSKLSKDEVGRMVRDYDFVDTHQNRSGKGIDHYYQTVSDDKVVYDALTGLYWQQSGSSEPMTYAKAARTITDLNTKAFAGYSDWRLPTLEEAMSLMTPNKNNAGLHIDAVFDGRQRWIWTSDKLSASSVWVVFFGNGVCYGNHVVYGNFVRAVR
ncbi:MAG: DUF1566 domain-containing protein [bacterium]